MHVTLYEVPEDNQLLVWWLYDFTNLLCKSVSVMRDLFGKNKSALKRKRLVILLSPATNLLSVRR